MTRYARVRAHRTSESTVCIVRVRRYTVMAAAAVYKWRSEQRAGEQSRQCAYGARRRCRYPRSLHTAHRYAPLLSGTSARPAIRTPRAVHQPTSVSLQVVSTTRADVAVSALRVYRRRPPRQRAADTGARLHCVSARTTLPGDLVGAGCMRARIDSRARRHSRMLPAGNAAGACRHRH